MTFNSVVLPDPDGPRITTNSPGATSSATPRNASTTTAPVPYRFVQPDERHRRRAPPGRCLGCGRQFGAPMMAVHHRTWLLRFGVCPSDPAGPFDPTPSRLDRVQGPPARRRQNPPDRAHRVDQRAATDPPPGRTSDRGPATRRRPRIPRPSAGLTTRCPPRTRFGRHEVGRGFRPYRRAPDAVIVQGGGAVVLEFDTASKQFGPVTALDACTFSGPTGPAHRLPRPERRREDDGHARGVRARRARCRHGAVAGRADRTAPSGPRFGYMPEERGLYPRMRVRDQLVYLGRALRPDAAATSAGASTGGSSGSASPTGPTTASTRCRTATSSASSSSPRS